jgi:hypothetical protein
MPSLSGSEPFHHAGRPLGFDLTAFWFWSSSNLMGNALRGLVAEYLVAQAVGAADGTRLEWDACDVRTPSGLRIEVKTSGRIQTWEQRRPSAIKFDIAPKFPWDARTNVYGKTRCRSADVYVFAIHKHEDRATADPLDVSQWEFLVLPTRVLNERCPAQKSIALASLRRLGPASATFGELRQALQGVAPHEPGITR